MEAYNHRKSEDIICTVVLLNKLQIAWAMYSINQDTMTEIYETHIDRIDTFSNNIDQVINRSEFNGKNVIICGETIDNFIKLKINNKYKVVNSSSQERIINLATIGLNK